MATKYEEELEKAKLQEEKPIQQPQQQSTLKGVSENTQQQLGVLSQGYQPSQNVNAAQQYLQGIIDKKPGEFNSQYAPQITQLYDQIMNRGKFQYDVNADPLWQQYKNAYMQGGQQAMQDTVGTMAGLTGGYGNSFAGAAGQQQYQEYLKQMTGMIPQLQAQAYDRYQQEGQDLQNLLGITQALEETEYGRHRDTVADWMNDRNFAQGAYESAYDRDYQNYANMLNYWQQQGQLENKDYWTDQEYGMAQQQMQMAQAEFELNKAQAELQMKLAQGEFGIAERSAAFDQAIAMMQMGMTPNADLLAMAGLTPEQAAAYIDKLFGNKGSKGSTETQGSGFWDKVDDAVSDASYGLGYDILGIGKGIGKTIGSLLDVVQSEEAKDWVQNYYDPSKANQRNSALEQATSQAQEAINKIKEKRNATPSAQTQYQGYSAEQNAAVDSIVQEALAEQLNEELYKEEEYRNRKGIR